MIRDELYLEVRSMIGRTTPTDWLEGDWAEGSVDGQRGAVPASGNGGRPRRGLTAREQVALRWLIVATGLGVLGALFGRLAGFGPLGVTLSAVAMVLLLAAVVGYVVLTVRMRRRGRRIDRERDDRRA